MHALLSRPGQADAMIVDSLRIWQVQARWLTWVVAKWVAVI